MMKMHPALAAFLGFTAAALVGWFVSYYLDKKVKPELDAKLGVTSSCGCA